MNDLLGNKITVDDYVESKHYAHSIFICLKCGSHFPFVYRIKKEKQYLVPHDLVWVCQKCLDKYIDTEKVVFT